MPKFNIATSITVETPKRLTSKGVERAKKIPVMATGDIWPAVRRAL